MNNCLVTEPHHLTKNLFNSLVKSYGGFSMLPPQPRKAVENGLMDGIFTKPMAPEIEFCIIAFHSILWGIYEH